MKSILEEVIVFARSKHFLYLELSSRPKRIAANTLYKELGFEQTANAVENEAFGRNYYRFYL